MPLARPPWLVFAVLALAGCYESHRRPEEERCPGDLRPEPEWLDATPPPLDAPALEMVGEPRTLVGPIVLGTDRPMPPTGLALARDGDGSVLVVADVTSMLFRFDASGAPRGDALVLPPGGPVSLAVAGGRYGLALGAPWPRDGSGMAFGALDDELALVGDWARDPTESDARIAAAGDGDCWALASGDREAVVRFVDSDGVDLVPRHTLSTTPIGGPVVVTHGESTVALWPEAVSGLGIVLLGQRFVRGLPTGTPSVVSRGVLDEPRVAVVPVRDRVAILGATVGSSELRVTMFDPSAVSWGDAEEFVLTTGTRNVSIAAAPEHGFLVACAPTTLETVAQITVVGLDGRRWGRVWSLSSAIPPGSVTVSHLECVWTGSEVVAAWLEQRYEVRDATSSYRVQVARFRPTFL